MLKKTAGFSAVLRNKKREKNFQTKHKIGNNSFTRTRKLGFDKIRLNSKNGCIKHLSKYGIVGINKGLFTNACKKALKYA